MREVVIKANIKLGELVNILRLLPAAAQYKPILELDCGEFRCDTVEEVWDLAQEMLKAQQTATYEKLKDFAP